MMFSLTRTKIRTRIIFRTIISLLASMQTGACFCLHVKIQMLIYVTRASVRVFQVMVELEAVDELAAVEASELDAADHRMNVIKQQQMELLLEAAKEREDVRSIIDNRCSVIAFV